MERIYRYLKNQMKPFVESLYRFTYRTYSEPEKVGNSMLADIDRDLLKIFGSDNVYYIDIPSNQLAEFEKKYDFADYYGKTYHRYNKKLAEYFVVDSFLDSYNSNDNQNSKIYIDAASMGSPWALWISEKYGMKTYSIDICEPSNPSSVFLKADVSNMPFENDSIDFISMQSSLELLSNNTDIGFVKECCRVLKPRGKAVILPLYLHNKYINCYGIKYIKKSVPESTAIKCVRYDYNVPFTRIYSVQKLYERLIQPITQMHCTPKLCIINSETSLQDERDSFIYLRYALVIEK